MKVHKGKEFLWVEDDDGRGGFIAAEGEKTFLVLEDKDMFIARKMPRRNLGFGKRKGKGEPRSKSSLSERARPTEGRVWPTKTGIPTTRHTRERRERTIEIPYPFDGPSYDNGTGKGGKGVAETPGFSPLKRVHQAKTIVPRLQVMMRSNIRTPTPPQRSWPEPIQFRYGSTGSWHAMQPAIYTGHRTNEELPISTFWPGPIHFAK